MLPAQAGTTPAVPADPALDFAAMVAAHERVLLGVKTEVMSQEVLAGWFTVGKNQIRKVLKAIDTAEKVAGGWRVPLYRMPATYLRTLGVLRPAA